MADVVNAFVNSPNYERGALFVIYDEWGGFFDHVRPPRVPDDRASTDLEKDFGQMGFRVPAVAVSPVRAPRQEALALGARPLRLAPQPASTSTTGATATSRSSSSSPTASGSATSTRA